MIDPLHGDVPGLKNFVDLGAAVAGGMGECGVGDVRLTDRTADEVEVASAVDSAKRVGSVVWRLLGVCRGGCLRSHEL